MDVGQILGQPLLLQLLQPLFQCSARSRIGGANDESETCRDEHGVDLHVRLQKRSDDCAEEKGRPHRQKYQQLPRIHTDLSRLEHIEGAPPECAPKEEHGHAPHGGADVGDGPGHMRRADHGAEVRCAHGVLQAARHRRQACRFEARGQGDGRSEEQGVSDEGDAVEGFPSEVHLVFVDQHAARECAGEEGQDHRARHMCRLEAVPALSKALETQPDRRGAAGPMRDEEAPRAEGDGVHEARAERQGPSEDHHPDRGPLEAVPHGARLAGQVGGAAPLAVPLRHRRHMPRAAMQQRR
mmetsp:Transcript_57181/g.165690  ORF Transcript_57181/g.165690 Transcript_57181/m.165690 type:complete len:297 (+) Transcript_57181:567-1457(+)